MKTRLGKLEPIVDGWGAFVATTGTSDYQDNGDGPARDEKWQWIYLDEVKIEAVLDEVLNLLQQCGETQNRIGK